jgi:hypothetical protein
LELVSAQTSVEGVVKEVLIVVPIDEAIVQGGTEGGEDDQREGDRNQPGATVVGRQRPPTPPRLPTGDSGGDRVP